MVRAHRMSQEQRDLDERSGDEGHGDGESLAVPIRRAKLRVFHILLEPRT